MKSDSGDRRALVEAMLREQGLLPEDREASAGRPAGERRDSFPLSHAQERLWFLHRLSPESHVYNVPLALRFRGRLDPERLERAIGRVVGRHEILRVTFADEGGRARQRVAPQGDFQLRRLDLRTLDRRAREAEAKREVTREASGAFDLVRGPLLRATLILLEEEESLLLVTVHHIVFDALSFGIFLRELAEGYRALEDGRAPAPPELTFQYTDYAAAQREAASAEKQAQSLEYWRRKLGREPYELSLSFTSAKRGLTSESEAGAREAVSLSAEVTAALKRIALEESTSLFPVILAGFQDLLRRYSSQLDVRVGVAAAGRDRLELEGLIGLFVNILVMRGDLGGDPSFRELVRRLSQVSREAFAHQDLPFERLVAELQPERELGRHPLVQVLFVMHAAGATGAMPDFGGPRVSYEGVVADKSHFPLTLFLAETPTGLAGFFEYSRELFRDEDVRRLARHFTNLLESASASPERRLSALTVLSEAERRRVVSEWNETRVSYPKEATIADELEKRVQERPEAVALVGGEERLTYAELNARANAVASELQRRGVGANVLVGLYGERSLGLLVGLVAVAKAGGGYVPLEPSYPSERLRYLARDSGVSLVLEAGESGVDWGVPRLGLPSEESRVEENPKRRSRGEDIAYVTYTSGSTGAPKGVEVPHRAVMRLVFGGGYVSLGREERILQLAPVAFDASTFEIWGALLHGGRVVIYPERVPTASELEEVIAREGITTMWLTASLFNALVDEKAASLSGLRQLITGGEALSVRHVSKALEALQETTLWNGYGPTEGTTFTCCHRIPESLGMEADCDTIPIGRPIGNTRVYVLDAGMEPTAVGVPGELYIGGDGLARGYRGSPELTAAKFVPDPFGEEPGGRLYRTGDRVRYREDGRLEFLGRRDHQVKLRGFRIELGEIETALRAHRAVRDAVVTMREEGLAAYVVPADDALVVEELREELALTLPDYMVPVLWTTLDAFPLTENGKLDRRRLPVPAPLLPRDGMVAPRHAVERELAALWAEVLGTDRFGVHDNFFQLGGDSILILQVVARAKARGLELTTRDMFRHQTIAELAARVGKSATVVAEQGIVERDVELSPMAHWFFERELPEAHHFNQSALLRCPDRLDREAMQSVLSALWNHHDALRLSYLRADGEWRGRLEGPGAGVPLSWVDGRDLTERELRELVEDSAERAQRSLSLAGPLTRVVVIEQEQGAWVLIVVHHLAMDAVSWRILLEDLERGYEQASRGEAVRLPAKTSSYPDWVEKARVYAERAELSSEVATWIRERESSRAVAAPAVDFAEGEEANLEGSVQEVKLSLLRAESAAVLDGSHRAGVEPPEVLLAALGRAFAEQGAVGGLLVDVEGHGREPFLDDVDVSRTVGWFTSIEPVLLPTEREAPAAATLASVHDRVRALPHGGAGLGLLRLWGAGEVAERLRRLPKARVSFNFLGKLDRGLLGQRRFRWAEERSGRTRSAAQRRSHWIDVSGFVLEGRVHLTFLYSKNMYRRETIEALAERFRHGIQWLIDEALTAPENKPAPSPRSAGISRLELERALGQVTFD